MATFISMKKVKTRTDHICFGCCEMIPKGSPAWVQVNSDCGKIYSLHTCLHCEDIMQQKEFKESFFENELDEGCVRDFLRECLDFQGTPEEYLSRP